MSRVHLRKRELKGGRASLYLDFFQHGRRQRKSLGIILERPDTTEKRNNNRTKIRLGQQMCAQHELHLLTQHTPMTQDFAHRTLDFINSPTEPAVSRKNLFHLLDEWTKTYKRRDIAVVRAMTQSLKIFCCNNGFKQRSPETTEVDSDFCQGFREHLYRSLNGSTPAGYFRKFKQFLQQLTDKNVFAQNPAARLRVHTDEALRKNVLSFDELNRLAATPATNAEVKRAFLFACNTGLRWCDVKELRQTAIADEGFTLHLVQQKVLGRSRNAALTLPLNSNARQLLGHSESARPEEKVFRLPSYNHSLRILQRWMQRSGINKHITFHCARHTFISNLIAQGASLPLSASLAGHSTTKHTERYIHLNDNQRKEAVDRLPPLQEPKN